VSFELSLPVGLQAKLATSNGAITVNGGVRGLEANTSNGRVSFSLPGFQVQLERSSFIARQPGEEPTELTLQTSNGPITVR
jgi:DUF4097 and DUF4098 domain-containing protein YvlB